MLPTFITRMKLIEEISGSTTDLGARKDQAREASRLTPKEAPWLNDDLLLLFHKEYTQHPEGQQLSDGVGKRLW